MGRNVATTRLQLPNGIEILQGTADPSAGAGVPAVAGSFYLRTTGQSWLKTGAADTAWTLIGQAAGQQFFAELDRTAFGFSFVDDLTEEALSTLTNTGAGAAQVRLVNANNRPGVVEQQVLTAGVSATRISPEPTSALIFFGGGEFRWKNAHQIPVLSNGVENVTARIGAHDAAGVADVTDGVYFEYDLVANGNQNYWLCAANNSVRTKADTLVSAVAATWRTVQLVVNAAGTLVSGSIDGIAFAATVATNIPTALARATRTCSLQAVKQLGVAVSLTVQHDFYAYAQSFTVPR